MTTTEVSYTETIEAWRAQVEQELRADDSWLTLAGLFWLQEGRNSVGADPESDIVLPTGSAPDVVGAFQLDQGQVTFEPAAQAASAITINGAAPTGQVLRAIGEGGPDLVTVGALTMFVHRSGHRSAIRLRDRNHAGRQEFTGRVWFPVQAEYCVNAAFVPYDPPKMITIMNIVGDSHEAPSPGYLVFQLQGQEYRLDATGWASGGLSLHIHDLTSGKQTYPGGRFLKTGPLTDGHVTLDFNQAVSPPCAFTPFATCPVVLPQNKLPLKIEAGEIWNNTH